MRKGGDQMLGILNFVECVELEEGQDDSENKDIFCEHRTESDTCATDSDSIYNMDIYYGDCFGL